jgi:EAL and modified HD-GYP domain-containing signal transduction protein
VRTRQSGTANVLVARQPIVDRGAGVIAYELLARWRLTDVRWNGGSDGGHTTARVIAQAFLDMDVWSITEGLPAFINFPREQLLDGTVQQLPAGSTVVEILETVAPDAQVRRACRQLRAAGYRLALDDVVADDPRLALLDLVDVVKVDFADTTPAERVALLEQCRAVGAEVLAEKVETPAQQAEAARLGYDLFQGYFFQKPAVVDGRQPSVARLQHLQLLRSVLGTDIDRDAIGDVLARDPGAIDRFCHLVISLARLSHASRSVRVLLRGLDDREVVRYVTLLVVLWLAERHPRPLRDTALIRARFCERIVEHLDGDADPLDGYLVGLCSLLDALVDEPLADVLGRVHPPARLTAATVHRAGLLGRVLQVVETYEHGDWDAVRRHASALDVDGDLLGAFYLDCLSWTRQTVAWLHQRPS